MFKASPGTFWNCVPVSLCVRNKQWHFSIELKKEWLVSLEGMTIRVLDSLSLV